MRGTDRQREPERDRPEPFWHRWLFPVSCAVLLAFLIAQLLRVLL